MCPHKIGILKCRCQKWQVQLYGGTNFNKYRRINLRSIPSFLKYCIKCFLVNKQSINDGNSEK